MRSDPVAQTYTEMTNLPSPMRFPVSSDGIRAALDVLLARADALGIARPVAHRLAVIVDEYCSNLIRHDVSITPDSRFDLTVAPVHRGAAVTVRDRALPFDPTTARPLPERDLGGQGIVLMKGLAASLDYHSEPGCNVFRATVLTD